MVRRRDAMREGERADDFNRGGWGEIEKECCPVKETVAVSKERDEVPQDRVRIWAVIGAGTGGTGTSDDEKEQEEGEEEGEVR